MMHARCFSISPVWRMARLGWTAKQTARQQLCQCAPTCRIDMVISGVPVIGAASDKMPALSGPRLRA